MFLRVEASLVPVHHGVEPVHPYVFGVLRRLAGPVRPVPAGGAAGAAEVARVATNGRAGAQARHPERGRVVRVNRGR